MRITSINSVCCSTSSDVVAAWYIGAFFVWSAIDVKHVRRSMSQTQNAERTGQRLLENTVRVNGVERADEAQLFVDLRVARGI